MQIIAPTLATKYVTVVAQLNNRQYRGGDLLSGKYFLETLVTLYAENRY